MMPLWSLTQMTKNRKRLHLLHPLTRRRDTLQFMNPSQSHQYTLPLVKALMKRTLAVYLTWQHQLKRCSQPLTNQMTQVMKHNVLPLLMSMQTRDSFQDKDRQKTLAQALEDDLSKAPWQKESTKEPLEDLEKIAKVVKPIYDGFWCDRDQDIIDRLDQAAKRLKEKRAAQLQDNKEDDTVIPAIEKLHRKIILTYVTLLQPLPPTSGSLSLLPVIIWSAGPIGANFSSS